MVLGPKNSTEEAEVFAYEKLDIPFRVVGLPTKDKARAVSLMRGMRLDETGNLSGALERSMHRPPAEYEKQWWPEQEQQEQAEPSNRTG